MCRSLKHKRGSAGNICRDSVGCDGLQGHNTRDMKINWFKNVNVVHADIVLISKAYCDEFRCRDSSVSMAIRYGLDGGSEFFRICPDWL